MSDELNGLDRGDEPASFWLSIADEEEIAALTAALPEGWTVGETTAHVVFRNALDGSYGESHLCVWRRKLCGATRASILAPFQPLQLTRRARLEIDGLRAALVLDTTSGTFRWPILYAERERIADLLRVAVSTTARPPAPGATPPPAPQEDAAAPAPPSIPESTPEPPPAPEPSPEPTRSRARVIPTPTLTTRTLGDAAIGPWGDASTLEHVAIVGSRVIATCAHEHAHLWDLYDDQDAARFTAHDAPIQALATAPGAQRAATGDARGMLRVWSTDTLQEVRALKAKAPIRDVALSPDGNAASAVTEEAAVITWSGRRFKKRATWSIPTHTPRFTALRDEHEGYVVCEDGTVHLVEWSRNARSRVVFSADSAPTHAALDPYGQLLAIATANTLTVIDTEAHAIEWHAPIGPIHALCWVPGTAQLAISDADGAIRTLDARGTPQRPLNTHTPPAGSVAISADGEHLATAGATLGMFRTHDGQPLRTRGHSAPIRTAHLTINGREAVTASSDGQIIGWNTRDGSVAWELRAGLLARVTPNHRHLLVADRDRLDIWDLRTDAISGTLTDLPDRPRGLHISPGSTVAALLFHNTPMLWIVDVHLSRHLHTIHAPGDGAATVALHGDLAVIANDLQLVTFNIAGRTPSPLRLTNHHAGTPHDATFSPGGDLLAVGFDRAVRIYRAQTTELLHEHAVPSPATALCFAPDGDTLHIGHHDGSLSTLATESGEPLQNTPLHAAPILDLTSDRDGTTLLAASADTNASLLSLSYP